MRSEAALVIRLLGDVDIPALVPLVQEMDMFYGEPAPSPAAIENAFRALPSGVAVLLALSDGAPVGFASYATLFPGRMLQPTLYLKDLYVCAAHRRRGIARRLIAALAATAIEQQCERMDWTTGRDNRAARLTYERLGAAHVEDAVQYRLDGPALNTLADEA